MKKTILPEDKQSLQGTSGILQQAMRDTAVTMKLVGDHVMRVTMTDRQQRPGLNGMTIELRGVDEDWTNENVSMAEPMMVVHQDNVMISMMIGREVGNMVAAGTGRLHTPDGTVMMRTPEEGILTKETIIIVRTLVGTAFVGNLDGTLTDDFGMSQ